MTEIITTRETMEMLGFKSTKPVCKLLKAGLIKGYREKKRFGRRSRWRVDKQSVIDYKNYRRSPGRRRFPDGTITTKEAAEILDTTQINVAMLCRMGNLDAIKRNHCWAIFKYSVRAYQKKRENKHESTDSDGNPVDGKGRHLCSKCQQTMTHKKIGVEFVCAGCQPKRTPERRPIPRPQTPFKLDYSGFRKRATIPEHMLS